MSFLFGLKAKSHNHNTTNNKGEILPKDTNICCFSSTALAAPLPLWKMLRLHYESFCLMTDKNKTNLLSQTRQLPKPPKISDRRAVKVLISFKHTLQSECLRAGSFLGRESLLSGQRGGAPGRSDVDTEDGRSGRQLVRKGKTGGPLGCRRWGRAIVPLGLFGKH